MASDTEKRLSLLERRVAYLEAKLAGRAPVMPVFEAVLPAEAPAAAVPAARSPRAAAAAKAAPSNYKAPMGAPSVTGSDLLAGVAVLCFVLGAGYLVKLAVDYGWLDPARRILLAALFGCGLMGAGLFMPRKDKAYAAYLPAAGSVVLYLAAYAGQLLYGLYGPAEAMAMIAGITVLTLGLFKEFSGAAYVIVALLGCYSVPVFSPALQQNSWLLLYFIVWDLTFVVLAILARQRSLMLVTAYLALAAFSMASALTGSGHAYADGDSAAFLGVQMLIFMGASVGFSIVHRQPMDSSEAWSALPLLIFFYGLEYALMQRLAPDLAPWIGLAWAALVLAVYGAAREGLERRGLEAGPMVSAYLTFIALHACYLELLPVWAAPWVGLAFIPLLGLLLARPYGHRHFAVSLGLGLVISLEFLRVLFDWRGSAPLQDAWALNLAYAAVLLLCGILYLVKEQVQDRQRLQSLQVTVFAAAHLQALCGILRVCELQPDRPTGFGVSVAWAVYGLLVLGGGWGLRRTTLARSGVLVLLLAAAKAMLLDISGAEPIYRVVAFMVLGLLLYAGGWVLKQTQEWIGQ